MRQRFHLGDSSAFVTGSTPPAAIPRPKAEREKLPAVELSAIGQLVVLSDRDQYKAR